MPVGGVHMLRSMWSPLLFSSCGHCPPSEGQANLGLQSYTRSTHYNDTESVHHLDPSIDPDLDVFTVNKMQFGMNPSKPWR